MAQAAADYRFDVWTAESGLPQNTIVGLLQSRDGYLWIGTFDGLARFDGVRFTTFNKANSPGLPTNRITHMYEDHDGALWIGFDDGELARYYQGTFTSFGSRRGLPATPIESIEGDDEGHLWVLTGHAVMHWEAGRFRPGMSPSNTNSFAPYVIPGNQAMWATNQNALQIFSHGKLTTFRLQDGLPTLRIGQVDEDRDGTWWLATAGAGLVKVQQGKIVKIYTQEDGLPSNDLHDEPGPTSAPVACADRKGNLWLAGAGPWLGRFKDGVFTAYPSTNTAWSPPETVLPASFISILFEDREGNLWIATEGSGLIRVREQVVTTVLPRVGPRPANIYPICEDRQGTLWLGDWERGLTSIHMGVVTNFTLSAPYNLITAICEDRDGRLWLGTYAGLVTFQNGAVSQSGIPEVLSHHVINAICQDRHGALWLGAERGLFRYWHDELTFFTKEDGLVAGFLTVIIEDRAGALWIGGHTGLTRLDHGHFTTWTEKDGLPSNHVRALYEDGDGTLWVGTYDGGLGRFKDGRFTRYSTKSGMFDDGVFQILEDARGDFWMSSNRGIHRASKRELNDFAEGTRRTITSVPFGKSDGMLNAECNGGCWPSGVKTRDGKLWFPTQNGAAVIDPANLPPSSKPPPIVVEAFIVDRQPQPLDRPLRVQPGKANIEIQYTALSFINSERISFKYRLEGVDDDWVEVARRRTAYYFQLRPGRYQFTVLAANSDGVWNETGASLAFVVLPAWYQTWWFRTGAGAGIAALVGFAFRSRLARLERARAAEKEFSRRLMESQERERQRLAAELHDGLGQNLVLVKNLALLEQLDGANENKSLARANDIVAAADRGLEEVHAISYALRPPELDRLGLAQALAGMVRRAGEASRIRFQTHIEFNGALPPGSDIQLFRIAQEAVNNLVKHSGAGNARVELWQDEGGVHLVVADDGRGLPGIEEGADRVKGLGLSSIDERALLIGAHCKWLSEPGKGTTMSVLIPPSDAS